jgi:hypothetical protein
VGMKKAGARKDLVREDIWRRSARCSLAAYPHWGTQLTDHVDSRGSGEKGNIWLYVHTKQIIDLKTNVS